MNIIITGDFAPGYRIADALEKNQYQDCFKQVRDITLASDYALVNLECPIVKRKAKPIVKCGPNLKCTSKVVDAIKYAGFRGVTLANNHIYDFGETGLADTIEDLTTNQIDYMGGGRNLSEASSIFYKTIVGQRLAIINCCEHEFSIATEQTGGANPLNPIQQYYAIKEAKQNADYVIVIVHGGHEHYQLPSPRMQETYRFFVDAGADAIVNHHQHCYSGYEIYKEKPIFYGLGNFCFDEDGQRDSIWNYGYMVELHLEKNISFTLYPYEQCNHTPIIQLLENNDKIEFDKQLQHLNAVIISPKVLQKEHEKWMEKDARNWLVSLSPFSNRYIQALIRRKFLPFYLTKKKITALVNKVACEAHRDKFIYILSKQL